MHSTQKQPAISTQPYVELLEGLDVIVIICFMSTKSLFEVDAAMPKKTKLFYKYLIVDLRDAYRKSVNRPSQKERKSRTSIHNLANVPAKAGVEEFNRNKLEVFFHLICTLAGLHFAAIFSNWTSVADVVFFNGKIVDYQSVWVRFVGMCTGLLYVFLIGLRNRAQ